ncbi:MAG: hypothetical protein JXR31_10570 [Prolixibacteraceae bacterium]|nr:hypothetical protein [Prolixibacteraceae bacterium]MBN2774683.1 hypothetical protein [Prolixibacteraceae bacterium]
MKTDSWKNEIEEFLKNRKIEEAELILKKVELENPDNIGFWIYKGQFYQRIQNWPVAINSFNKVLELEPENNLAKSNIEIIQSILNFWNPEMFNA